MSRSAIHNNRTLSGWTFACWDTPCRRAERLYRTLLGIVEMLGGQTDPLVAEIGCGAGRLTNHLSGAGLRVIGLDLSPEMVRIGHATYQDLWFAAAHAGALPLRAGTVDGLVAWYSLINLPTDALCAAFLEFARVTRPGATVLVAFQAGSGQRVDRTTSYEQPVPLSYYRHDIDDVSQALEQAGFALYAKVHRMATLWFESRPQAALLAQRRQRG